ncbi:MAG TPA: YceI family protein [Candidatus Kapabacteria bacterium]|nr:YceI family protein [Candidatus Kapabacteria bacterium]
MQLKAIFRSKLSYAVFLLGMGMLGAGGVQAQRLAVASGGEKLLTLNDNVNKNQFIWTSDAPLESIRGTSEGVAGTFTIDPQDLSSLRGTITTQVATMKTGNDTRDNHLHSSEWLDASRFPIITFTITSMGDVKTSGNSATGMATGNFTMHGVTKRVSIPFKMTYLVANASTRQRAPGDLVMISADFDISLKDFNIAGTEGVIGSKVGEKIKITAQLFGNALPRTTT